MRRFLDALYRAAGVGDEKRVPALDGARALMVFFVACFHVWQQSWLTPTLRVGGKIYSLDTLLRTGYIWVDGMLLLSGFLLYYPYAAAPGKGKPLPSVGRFYLNRVARIVPSYYLCILVMLLCVALPYKIYPNAGEMAKDVLAHLTFTHTFFFQSYHNTPLNGALWTLAVEMQFYLVFPLLARLFSKRPLLTYFGMTGAAFLFRGYALGLQDARMWLNQMPAFLDVYANGFAAAACYAALKKRLKDEKWPSVMMGVSALAAALAAAGILEGQAGAQSIAELHAGQMTRRYPFSLMLSVMMVALPLSPLWVRALLGNRLMRFFSAVSFQFYIWHQVFAVQLRRWGVPPSRGLAPNQTGEQPWQTLYVLMCFLGALAISVLVTYLFERPVARAIRGQTTLKGRN